ncbi:MAG: hypothetical protein IIA67_02585, partial [Planctomycetes bacterium]|nr:hypothetical protein [Planctomycetota bacterium]
MLAAFVSMGALLWAAGAGRQAIGLAVSPFGWQRLVVVHVFSSLLLSWTLAALAAEAMPVLRSRWFVGMWIVVGAALAWWTVSRGSFVAHAMDANRFGYGVRLAVRILWPVLLQLPWCLTGAALAGETVRTRSAASRTALAALSLTAALVAPACYLSFLTNQQMPAVVEMVAKPRIVQGEDIVATAVRRRQHPTARTGQSRHGPAATHLATAGAGRSRCERET